MCELKNKTYIVAGDDAVIEKWASDKNIAISFRPGGDATLSCLKRGAGAKPHTILEKTIKLKNVASADKVVNDFLNKFQDIKVRKLVTGLVGHWTDAGIEGIYLTQLGTEEFQNSQFKDQVKKEQGNFYLELKTETEVEALVNYYNEFIALDQKNSTKRAKYLFSRRFFSGDYDVHDMLQVGQPIVSKRDLELLKDLQKELIAARQKQLIERYKLEKSDFQVENPDDYQRVQHGAQVNYIAQMINENVLCNKIETLNLIVNVVADMNPPVMIYDKKLETYQWKELPDRQAVKDYYEAKGIVIKDTWEEQTQRDKHIQWTIKKAIELLGLNVTRGSIPIRQALPQFVEVYGKNFDSYVEPVLDKINKQKLY